jgi:uncharacterized RDD family membrane protein YckC
MNVQEPYRTFWPRFWAGAIDALVLLPLLPLDLWIEGSVKNVYVLAAWYVVYAFIYDIYTVAMHAWNGQTVGKMITGVRVLDLSGGKLSFPQALLRDSVPILLNALTVSDGLPRVLAGADPYAISETTWLLLLPAFGGLIWFAAELLTMLLNSKRRAVHDFIAHSVVVRLSAYRAVAHDEAGAA